MRKLYEIFKVLRIQKRIVSAETICGNTVVSALSFLLCNENLNSLLTRMRKLFKGGNCSREETIRGNTVCYSAGDTWVLVTRVITLSYEFGIIPPP